MVVTATCCCGANKDLTAVKDASVGAVLVAAGRRVINIAPASSSGGWLATCMLKRAVFHFPSFLRALFARMRAHARIFQNETDQLSTLLRAPCAPVVRRSTPLVLNVGGEDALVLDTWVGVQGYT